MRVGIVRDSFYLVAVLQIDSVAVSADGRAVVSGGADGCVTARVCACVCVLTLES